MAIISIKFIPFDSSFFTLHSSFKQRFIMFIACHFLQMHECICHLWLAQTAESHTLVKAGQATDGKLC